MKYETRKIEGLGTGNINLNKKGGVDVKQKVLQNDCKSYQTYNNQ